MGYQSKTWSLSDEVVAEIDRRVQVMVETTGSGSPNRVLKDLLLPRKATLVNRLTGEKELGLDLDAPTDLDATGPQLSSGKGKATVETRSGRKPLLKPSERKG